MSQRERTDRHDGGIGFAARQDRQEPFDAMQTRRSLEPNRAKRKGRATGRAACGFSPRS